MSVLDRRWRNACKVVFGQEVGALEQYMPWLEGMIAPNVMRKSSISGKEVAYAIGEYAENLRWVSFDEVGSKFGQLSTDGIKGMESLLEAVGKRAQYAGNIVLGNSAHVEKSSSISDSFYMYGCSLLGDSKYCANCSTGRLCVDSFGTHGPGESEFCIRCTQTYRDKRCFELWLSQNCSDCYYSYNLNNCTDCIFCFNVKNKRNCIGNLQLPREKYLRIKDKLLAEMADALVHKKKLPSLMELAAQMPPGKPNVPKAAQDAQDDTGKNAAEGAFGKTTALLLGTPLKGIDSYKKWLERHIYVVEGKTSVASGRIIWTVPYGIAVVEIPKHRIVAMDEALEIGKLSIGECDAEKITLSNAPQFLKNLAFFPVEFRTGTNIGTSECATVIDSTFSYRTSDMVYSKYCGYTFYPRSSEHAFGCNQIFDSSFCINCYYSVKLTRCFEMDSCRGCSDCLFCHNCENVHESMFCFNAKNLKNAIGNVQLAPEEYMRIKKLVLGEIARKLERDKNLGLDIYNVGAAKRKN
ncbi:Uncharacterised protein [Candidatus Anstonella stagnisolia]|nr:Uncharacterised protein [Candidatus Anstonella stagnisolia]